MDKIKASMSIPGEGERVIEIPIDGELQSRHRNRRVRSVIPRDGDCIGLKHQYSLGCAHFNGKERQCREN